MLNSSLNFLVRCSQTGQVWLFNCPDSCQQILTESKIRTSQIRHIVITSLQTQDINGLIGLLSSLSLNDSINSINLYGPPGLLAYLNLARKYSKTTFRYHLNIYIKQNSYTNSSDHLYICIHPNNRLATTLKYHFIEKERKGRFQSVKAVKYGLRPGPIYGHLKLHRQYILPDGTILSGQYFTHKYSQGIKILCFLDKYGYRINYELFTSSIYRII
uniref:Ribonuclease Z n=1 Tax=Helminthora furcellata TaxID=1884666 RepID=A0A1G4NQZ6_9FLOR|nr:Ribonuclease Z [Helminthora furcellata]SCW21054.1 Ribonuclease Z [Helminthora furcellata]SCW23914.1 Ribonuclease Z [Helminthora furcellata]